MSWAWATKPPMKMVNEEIGGEDQVHLSTNLWYELLDVASQGRFGDHTDVELELAEACEARRSRGCHGVRFQFGCALSSRAGRGWRADAASCWSWWSPSPGFWLICVRFATFGGLGAERAG